MGYRTAAVLTAGLAFCVGLTAVPIQVTAVSSRPDMVTGDSVLVRIDLADSLPVDSIKIRLNGADLTATFHPGDTPESRTALVTGLKPGRNSIELVRTGSSEEPAARLMVTSHPRIGPIFSGPHERPFICQTGEFELPDGSMLGQPLDENCTVKTVVTYVYRSNAPGHDGVVFRPLPGTAALPTDVASTTTSLGQSVPYVVRVETGTINRAIYQIAVLHNPAEEDEPGPFLPPKSWNKRLLYSFGGGCTGGWYKQGKTMGLQLKAPGSAALIDAIVGKGYASASSTLNVFGNNCQDVTAAETMMMVKEHFIETYGAPLFTFGRGGSGGSYQQNQIADNYPGLLDGIIPAATFPDVLATIQFLTDAQLLDAYFDGPGSELTNGQKLAIAGVGVIGNISRTANGAGRINPSVFCPPELPQSLRYDAATNPSGARCDVFDHTVNVYGRDPATGFARRPVDNTGVQYGLSALNAGTITAAEFLDLNEKIGGHDNDGRLTPERSVADPLALRAAYQTGRLTNGGGGLGNVPIIDLRRYQDRSESGDLHLKYHSFSFRERLLRANGTTANQVLLVHGSGPRHLMEQYTIGMMDEWLSNLSADTSTGPAADKVVRAKPAGLADSCYSPSGERIVETQTFSGGACNALYPTYPSPRMIAGGPVTNDILKCRLKPVDLKDYQATLSDEQVKRLKTIFPDGVCDWNKLGVGQGKLTGTWLSY